MSSRRGQVPVVTMAKGGKGKVKEKKIDKKRLHKTKNQRQR